jgi:NAD+ synthase
MSPTRLVIASVQANPTVGAIEANAALAKDLMARASAMGADVALFPELFLIGYPPEDLALKPAALRDCERALDRLAAETAGGCAALITLACSHPDGHPRNAVALIDRGEVKGIAYKMDLPNYGVFDEKRIFAPGDAPGLFEVRGVKIGVPICEDIWAPGPCADLAARGAELLLVPNGSPYRRTSTAERMRIAEARVAETGLPLIYVNQVGGQDELVFDGGSFALSASGEMVASSPTFADDLSLSTWERGEAGWRCVDAPHAAWPEPPEAFYRAMVVGLRDYVRKSGFKGVLLGLSGGVDSAISLVVARDALGAENVRAVMLPSRYTSQDSLDDAADCARRCGVRLDQIAISPAVDALETMLGPVFEGRQPDITEENLQARIRGVTLMAMSNKLGAMLMTTGNKSEMAVGYATLYGDMCGGYNVLKDLYKEEVYAVCAWRNAHAPYDGPVSPIPERVLTKAPSAELDAILHALIEQEATLDQIVAQGFDPATVERVQRLLYNSEYKRRQAAPGVKIGSRAFGRDRRYPIVNGFRDRVGGEI